MKTFNQLETESFPRFKGGFLIPSSAEQETEFGTIVAKSTMLPPASRGKGFKTLWYQNGKRITKAKAKEILG